MEKSMSEGVEPGQRLNSPLMFTIACGFGLYWACFFTMLMRNSFMDGGIELLWYHLFLRILFLAGGAATCLLMAWRADFFATERGMRVQKGGVGAFSVVAATSSLLSHSLSMAMPLAFDCGAWGLAGMGLACLLMLWVELLGALGRRQVALGLAASVAFGAAAYLVMNMLPLPFNIGLLCLSPLASVALVTMLERSGEVVPAAFVPRDESRKQARLALPFKAMSAAYGVVFGLGIGSTTQIQGGALLYSGIAALMALGAVAGALCLRFMAPRIQHSGAFQLLFPVLIIALIPMSFLQGLPAALCNLLVLGCYTLFEIVGIYVGLFLAARHGASRVHLVASIQACLYLGLLGGHAVGLLATSSGVMDYAMLSAAALGLVAALAVAVTMFSVGPLASKEEARADATEENAPGLGRWKAQCQEVARASGLSARETEVFMLLAKGRGIEHIQSKLCISGHTVKSHVYNIYRKMGIGSREELLDAVEEGRLPGKEGA